MNEDKELLRLLESGEFNPRNIIKEGDKPNLRRIIKTTKLTINQVKNIWKFTDLRWDIVRTINVPEDLQKELLNDDINLTRATLKEFIQKQKFTDTHIMWIYNKFINTPGFFFLWESKTRQLLDLLGVDRFIKDILPDDWNKWEGRSLKEHSDLAVRTIISIVKEEPSSLKKFLTIISPDFKNGEIYTLLAKRIKFEDDTIDYIKETLKKDRPLLYAQVMEVLIKTGNISVNKQALYLLEKY